MDFTFTHDDLSNFVQDIWDPSLAGNNGGMGAPDLFSLFVTLKRLQPNVIVESGVWNGISTKLIRKVCPDATIFCLDPRDIPAYGFRDSSPKTTYFTGTNFRDFQDLDLTLYKPQEILCFFDCHQNAYKRLQQCLQKEIQHILFNDNYPPQCGSHFTIQHLIEKDYRHDNPTAEDRAMTINRIQKYHVFPNVFPGEIKTGEGLFPCTSFFTAAEESQNPIYTPFRNERNRYRWNTYVYIQ
jgi:hypothetical protein